MLSVQMFSFIILSVCLIRIPSIVLAALFRELTFGNPADMNEMVAKWNRHYLLICDLVADLNDFLGQSLLLFIGFSFFTSISYSFTILYVVFIKSDVPFPLFYDDIFIVIQNLVCFIFLTFASEKIPQQASDLYEILMTITISNDFKSNRFRTLPIDCGTSMFQTARLQIRQVLSYFYKIEKLKLKYL